MVKYLHIKNWQGSEKMILTYILSIEDDEKRNIVESIYDLYYKKMYSVAF